MSFVVELRDRGGLKLLGSAARQVPFVISKSINDTLKQSQKAERAVIKQRFTLRRPQFILRGVKIARGDFATKTKLEGRIHIDPRTDFLVKFEKGGIKKPRGGVHLAVPIEAKRTGAGIVVKRMRPSQLNFRRVGGRIIGDHRTFIMPGIGIFQRFGPKRRSRIRLLYRFKPSVPIPRQLGFEETIAREVQRRYDDNFAKNWDLALRTAR